MLRLIFLSTLSAILLHGLETSIPPWVLPGILHTETRSTYRVDGSIKYVDMRRGSAGEYGPFQMTRAAFNQVKRKGEMFWKLETDTKYAEQLATRYLLWIDKHYSHGNWHRAVEMYNAGPNKHSTKYLNSVLKYGTMYGPSN